MGIVDGFFISDPRSRLRHYLGTGRYLLFATSALWKGLFLVGFFVVIVGLVDNILRPLLVGKDTKMPDYLVLITTLGGLEIYGINGFVIGPVIAALFIACWNLLSGRDNRDNSEAINEEFIEEGKKDLDTTAEG